MSRLFYLLVFVNYLLFLSLFPLLHELVLPAEDICMKKIVYLTGTTIIVHVFASPFVKHLLIYGNLKFSNPKHAAAANLSATKQQNKSLLKSPRGSPPFETETDRKLI